MSNEITGADDLLAIGVARAIPRDVTQVLLRDKEKGGPKPSFPLLCVLSARGRCLLHLRYPKRKHTPSQLRRLMIEPNESSEVWEHCLAVVRPALLLAPSTYLRDVQHRLAANGLQIAVARHDTAAIFDWIVRLLDRQGISNAAAMGFAEQHGSARWQDVEMALMRAPRCSKLRSYWHFHDCAYRKGARTCARPDLLEGCVLPRLPARKGPLNQAAFSLALFIRDVCSGDLVDWIDGRLAAADPGRGVAERALLMRDALLHPLTNIAGTGAKIWSMVLAELLLGGDPSRERWTTTGASFVAVDSLVHAYLHRTGILRRLDAEHVYGPACYAPGDCAEVIAALAERIDAREFNADFPACFPWWLQFAVWWFCAVDGWSICNGNRSKIGSVAGSDFAPLSGPAIGYHCRHHRERCH